MANTKLIGDQRIYIDCRRLIDFILDITPGFPRAYKFTIGSQMHGIAVRLISHVSAAYFTRNREERVHHLEDFQADFEVMRTLVRIAGERRWIAGRSRHADIIELMDGIGRQVAGWKNASVRPDSRQD